MQSQIPFDIIMYNQFLFHIIPAALHYHIYTRTVLYYKVGGLEEYICIHSLWHKICI